MLYVYLFTLIIGGILLGASILLGGDSEGDLDGDVEADLDLDHDLDADMDLDADGHVDLSPGAEGGDFAHGGFDGLMMTFVSLRFWTFFSAFFGLTGLTLGGLGLVESALVTGVLAVVMGFVLGYSAVTAIRVLRKSSVHSEAASDANYVGKMARVLVPINADHRGKVRLQLRGNTVDVLAVSADDVPIAAQEEVLIIELDGTTARVARVNES